MDVRQLARRDAAEIRHAGPAVDQNHVEFFNPAGAQRFEPLAEIMLAEQMIPVQLLHALRIIRSLRGSRHEPKPAGRARKRHIRHITGPARRLAAFATVDEFENPRSDFLHIGSEVLIEPGCFDIPIHHKDIASPLRQDGRQSGEREAASYPALVGIEGDDGGGHHSTARSRRARGSGAGSITGKSSCQDGMSSNRSTRSVASLLTILSKSRYLSDSLNISSGYFSSEKSLRHSVRDAWTGKCFT